MFSWFDPHRKLVIAVNNLCKEIEKMAINVAALTQAVTDLQTAAGVATAALDDLAAKVAAVPAGDDPAVQAAIDAAVTQIGTIKDGLNATAAKDDPAPPAA